MLNALFTFIAAVKNYVEEILAQFPLTSSALATVVATLVSKLGFAVSADQLTAIVVAVASIVGIIVHHSATAVALRKAEAAGK